MDPKDQEELSFLVNTRGRVRSKCTKLINDISVIDLSTAPKTELTGFIEDLQSFNSKLEVQNEAIGRLIFKCKDQKQIDAEYTKVDDYEVRINDTLKLLKNASATAQTQQASGDNNREFSGGSSQPKLPPLPLPTYAHLPSECLETFLEKFEGILGSMASMAEHKRFAYLEGQ